MRFADILELAIRTHAYFMTPIEKAKRLGTFNEIDRSRQYSDLSQIDLTRSLNDAWSKIRRLQTELAKRDIAIAGLHNKLRRSQIVNITLTAIITSLALKGLELLIAAATTALR